MEKTQIQTDTELKQQHIMKASVTFIFIAGPFSSRVTAGQARSLKAFFGEKLNFSALFKQSIKMLSSNIAANAIHFKLTLKTI